MPINFEPMQPFAPSISEAYGATQQGNQAAGVLASMAEAAARNRLNAQTSANELAYRAGQQNADRQSQDDRFQATRQDQRDRFQSSLTDVPMEQQYAAAAQAQMQAQRFQLQEQLNQSELNQGEKMRLQKMKQAMVAVDSDPNLLPEEKEAYKVQLQAGINPLDERQRRAERRAHEQAMQAQARERQMQAVHEGAAIQAQMKLDQMDVNSPQRMVPIPGGAGFMFQSAPGKWTHIPAAKPVEEKGIDIGKIRDRALKATQAKFSGQTIAPSAAAFQAEWDEQVRGMLNEAEVYGRQQSGPQQPGQPAAGGYSAQPGAQQPVGPGQPPPAAQEPPQPPIRSEDRKTWTPQQRERMDMFESFRSRIDSVIPEDKRDDYRRHVDVLEQLLKQYGSPANMRQADPEAHARYVKILMAMPDDPGEKAEKDKLPQIEKSRGEPVIRNVRF